MHSKGDREPDITNVDRILLTTRSLCAVAQYIVLVANTKVNSRGQNSHPPIKNPWIDFDIVSAVPLVCPHHIKPVNSNFSPKIDCHVNDP